MSYDNRPSLSWFLVFNHPQEIITYKVDSNNNYVLDANNDKIIESSAPSEYAGLTPEELCEKILDIWCSDSETKTGACAYCISKKGLHHLHIVLEDSKSFRFSAIKKLFPRAHIEPTRGNKAQAENYINKLGSYAEKGEQVVCIRYRGEIKGAQGQRNDLDEIGKLIEEGLRPKEILDKSIRYYKNETIVKAAYFRKREKETSIMRDVEVYYHVGDTGSGKTYSYVDLYNDHNQDVYLVNDYSNGMFDEYFGESILFLDEFRGQIPFSLLLSILQGYKQIFHARYRNIYGLWNEVHISSVIPPERLYKRMVMEDKDYDTFGQFHRRLNYIVYHYKDKEGNYKAVKFDAANYVSYDAMVSRIMGIELKKEFATINREDYEQLKIMGWIDES